MCQGRLCEKRKEKARLLGKLEGMLEVIRMFSIQHKEEYISTFEDIDQEIENVKEDIQAINEELDVPAFDGIDELYTQTI